MFLFAVPLGSLLTDPLQEDGALCRAIVGMECSSRGSMYGGCREICKWRRHLHTVAEVQMKRFAV